MGFEPINFIILKTKPCYFFILEYISYAEINTTTQSIRQYLYIPYPLAG